MRCCTAALTSPPSLAGGSRVTVSSPPERAAASTMVGAVGTLHGMARPSWNGFNALAKLQLEGAGGKEKGAEAVQQAGFLQPSARLAALPDPSLDRCARLQQGMRLASPTPRHGMEMLWAALTWVLGEGELEGLAGRARGGGDGLGGEGQGGSRGMGEEGEGGVGGEGCRVTFSSWAAAASASLMTGLGGGLPRGRGRNEPCSAMNHSSRGQTSQVCCRCRSIAEPP